jgi:hypothetical protein
MQNSNISKFVRHMFRLCLISFLCSWSFRVMVPKLFFSGAATEIQKKKHFPQHILLYVNRHKMRYKGTQSLVLLYVYIYTPFIYN